MPVIVDGNNVIGQEPGWHRDRPGARERLLERLAAYARVRRARVTVVFDGAPDRNAPDGSAFRGVRVLYAQPGSDADTRIESLVESSPDRRGITVVTSDRRLASDVRSLGATVVRSGEFRKQLEAMELEVETKTPSGRTLDDEELRDWLDYFGSAGENDL